MSASCSLCGRDKLKQVPLITYYSSHLKIPTCLFFQRLHLSQSVKGILEAMEEGETQADRDTDRSGIATGAS